MPASFATPEGTARFASRFPAARDAGFFRTAQSLTVSSVGLGSYLGNHDDATDRAYTEATIAALRGGINFLDTSLNYRYQRSERSLGAAFRQLIAAGELARDEVVVCTKAGYLVPGAIPVGALQDSDIVSGAHAMSRAFLADQLERSRDNLGIETIDVFYLHNPESQLEAVSTGEFYRRTRVAFELLEQKVADGVIRLYGAATWSGYRTADSTIDGISLAHMLEIARHVAGDANHFRFVQLPFNIAMMEGLTAERELLDDRRASTIGVALDSGLTVVASAAILQGRLSHDLPAKITQQLPGLRTDAQRAIQFARSAPGVSVALVGMSSVDHVTENLGVASVPPANLSAWFRPTP